MPKPEIILRLGSHAEKEYFQKATKLYDGVIVGANLLEVTPGATASFILKWTKTTGKPFFIDPITYSFGIGVEYLKSEKVNKKTGEVVSDLKKSFRALALAYGKPFNLISQADRAVKSSDFAGDMAKQASKSIGEYQLNRIRFEFEADPELKELAGDAPVPAAIFAPYLYCPEDFRGALDANLQLLRTMKEQFTHPVHAVICAHRSLLLSKEFLDAYIKGITQIGVPGVWLWFSAFSEIEANELELVALRKLTAALSKVATVYNLHGGYYSLCLSKFGMQGISHGVGYGEHKDVIPVVSAGLPSVRFHLPSLHHRYGVPDIERCFAGAGIKSPQDFFDKICDCVVCRGVVAGNVKNFSQFGDTYLPSPSSKKDLQTPASAKRARFHFLFARNKEAASVVAGNIVDLVGRIDKQYAVFANEDAIPGRKKNHVSRWTSALLQVPT